MAYKKTDNTPKFEQEVIQNANVFLREMAEEIVSISKARTPKRDGNLRRDILKQVLGLRGKVVWTKNYAAKMEEVQFKNYTTPGTGPNYAKDAVDKGINQTTSIAKKAGLI